MIALNKPSLKWKKVKPIMMKNLVITCMACAMLLGVGACKEKSPTEKLREDLEQTEKKLKKTSKEVVKDVEKESGKAEKKLKKMLD